MSKRIEFHTHTILSDGALLPSELIRRAYVADHEAIAITDHVDFSNVDSVIRATKRAAEGSSGIEVLVGAEITHVVPEKIPKLVRKAKALGAQIKSYTVRPLLSRWRQEQTRRLQLLAMSTSLHTQVL